MSQGSQNLGARPPLAILSACVDGFPVQPWWSHSTKKALWVTGWNLNPWNNMEHHGTILSRMDDSMFLGPIFSRKTGRNTNSELVTTQTRDLGRLLPVILEVFPI